MPITLNGSGQVIVQVQSVTKLNTQSSSATGVNAITGLSLNITPTSASNRILLLGMVTMSTNNANGRVGANFLRNGSNIAIADADGSMTRSTMSLDAPSNTNNISGSNIMLFLDSPATTSTITYAIAANNFDGQTWVVNRNGSSTDVSALSRTISTFTVMEISGT
jgi:hypothetical protein